MVRVTLRPALGILAGALLSLALVAPAASADAVVDGQWLCRDRGVTLPIRGARVELRTTGVLGTGIGAATVDTGFTDDAGNYHLVSHDGGDHIVRLVLRDAQGVHLDDSIVPWDWYTDSPTFNLGRGDNLVGADEISDGAGNTPVCAVWQGFHDSFLDFEGAVGSPPPYGNDLLIRGNFWPTAGVPFTLDTTVQWPGGFPTGDSPGDFTVARHEFGHTFRHAFDGDLPHFLRDVVVFDYAQNHTHCLASNPGFAFNEGWAEFWSGDTAACHPADPEAHQNVEGDVAASLMRLQAHCNDTRADMVHVLQDFPGQIHSFQEYADRINRCVPTPTPAPTPTPGTIGTLEGGVSPAVIRYLQQRQSSTQHEIYTLGQEVHRVIGALRKLPPCAGSNCDRRLPSLIESPILRGRIATLKLELSSLAPYATATGVHAFAKLRERKQITIALNAISHFNADLRGIDQDALQGALSAIRPALQSDHSPLARNLHTVLAQLLSQASHGKLTADLLSLGAPPGTATRQRESAHHLPAPKPFGGIFKPERVITLTCPGKALLGQSLKVSGTLSPALANAPITITYQGPKNTVTHRVATGASGTFADSATPDALGAWNIQSRYAGDLTYQSSSSPDCQSFVETGF